MQTLTEIRALLTARGVRPKHRLGQNFLHDHNILRILADAAGLGAGPDPGAAAGAGVAAGTGAAAGAGAAQSEAPLILEVGPGTGALTELLLERGARVVACELDRDMAAILRERVLPRSAGRLVLVESDCLDGKRSLSPALTAAITEARGGSGATPVAPSATFRLVSNLPYGAATPLLTTLLVDHPECVGLHATIQHEVAERLAAGPRDEAYGPISVLVGLLARVEVVAQVAPGCFWPAPKISSAIVSLYPHAVADRPVELRTPAGCRRFDRFVTGTFSRRRKQLGAILGRAFPFPGGIDARQRPEELSPAQWLDLWRCASAITSPADADRPSG